MVCNFAVPVVGAPLTAYIPCTGCTLQYLAGYSTDVLYRQAGQERRQWKAQQLLPGRPVHVAQSLHEIQKTITTVRTTRLIQTVHSISFFRWNKALELLCGSAHMATTQTWGFSTSFTTAQLAMTHVAVDVVLPASLGHLGCGAGGTGLQSCCLAAATTARRWTCGRWGASWGSSLMASPCSRGIATSTSSLSFRSCWVSCSVCPGLDENADATPEDAVSCCMPCSVPTHLCAGTVHKLTFVPASH